MVTVLKGFSAGAFWPASPLNEHSFNMPDIHIIVISSVLPQPTSAGQLLLYRHLVDKPHLTFEVHGDVPLVPSFTGLVRRVARRLSRTRFHRFVQDILLYWNSRWIDTALPRTISQPERTVVLTVAHGDGFVAAQRFARHHGLPLVSFFHDWWPDIIRVHSPFRRLIDHRFRALARESRVVFCVSEGMAEALGAAENTVVLYPIPEPSRVSASPQRETPKSFNVLYFGNLVDYGPMLGGALEASLKYPGLLLQARGAKPAWTAKRMETLRTSGRWLEFAPRSELDEWLATADAFLVAMLFAPAERRRMETSFPSKLAEFTQLGKPIVVWGPEYCSAVRWARNGNKALCVTSPNPDALLEQISILASDRALADRLASSARSAAQAEFNHWAIQHRFCSAIAELCKPEGF